MNNKPRLEESIKVHLAPVLRADGFKGSGRTFRRTVGDLVQVLNVQGSRDGGKFTINLGIQPLAIPDVTDKVVNPARIAEMSCEFRRRLGADRWFAHDASQSSMDQAVQSAAALYLQDGRQVLAQMSGPNSTLHTITPEELENGFDALSGFASTAVRTAFVLARFRRAQDNRTQCAGFARHALKHLNQATGLKRELESMIAWAQQEGS